MHALRGADALREAFAGKNDQTTRGEADVDTLQRDRASVYLLLAALLNRAPSAALLAAIGNLRGDASPLGTAQLALAEAARATTAEMAGREHFNILIGVGRGEVVPYASFYQTGFLNERPLAQVREDLGRLGIERRNGVFEPEDHIGTLFEVVAGLLQGELAASDMDAVQESDAFFRRHIAPWGARLMADIAAAPSAAFYRAVAHFGGTWIAIESEAMQLPG